MLVGFLRSSELNSGDEARLNFTHYLYMPFTNNGGNYHEKVSEAKLQRACGEDVELRNALGAAYMRECFRAQAFGRGFRRLRRFLRLPCEGTTYLRNWKKGAFPTFQRTKDMLEKDISTFMRRRPNGMLLVHVDEHRSMCPDPDFWRGAMRVLAELPGVQVLATYTDIPLLPKQKSSETCRRPIACLLPDVGTLTKERLPMDDIDVENEAILLRVATLRATLGLALQKLLLAGLHFPSSEIDRLFDKLNNMLGNAGGDVKARLEKCIEHCNQVWMDDRARQRKSLINRPALRN